MNRTALGARFLCRDVRWGERGGPMEQLEIDGVPVLWQPAPGPLNASLIFRVGRRDETFVRPLDETLQALRAAGYAPVEEDRDGSRVLRP